MNGGNGRKPLSLAGISRDSRDIIKAALTRGWTAQMTASHHVMLRSPDGTYTYVTGGTTRGVKASRNLKAALNRWEKRNLNPLT